MPLTSQAMKLCPDKRSHLPTPTGLVFIQEMGNSLDRHGGELAHPQPGNLADPTGSQGKR